jgi:hypothetical protein
VRVGNSLPKAARACALLDQMDDDHVTWSEVEQILLTGYIIERQKDRETREWKYVFLHDFAGFAWNFSALGVNQAGINASVICSHEYPPANRR